MRRIFVVLILIACYTFLSAQNKGRFSGNFQTDFQYYQEDSTIGAQVPDEKIGINSYANFNYTRGNFKAGVRYEGYFPPLNGFDQRYEGVGIPYKYLSYKIDNFEIVAGNFYEQFGSGMVLRAYEEKNLGYDNAFEGAKMKYNPIQGIYLKALFGKQRSFWNTGEGVVRGIDGEFNINDLYKKLYDKNIFITLGGSFVSKFQKDMDPVYKLPENVAAYAGRLNLTAGKISLSGEYAYKINDPSSDNGIIYKAGNGLIINGSYSQKGLGILLSAKRIDNMSFRSNRNASLADLNINYIPDITEAHSYSLAAMYPYATQPNGEIGFQGEINYKFKRKSLLGGKYGTGLSVNYSVVHGIDKQALNDSTEIGESGTDGYESDFFAVGDDFYYQDFNVKISKKINKRLKGKLIYQNQIYDNDVIHGAGDWHGNINAHIGIIDLTYKLKSRHYIRFEFQELYTEDQYGEWASGLIEYTIPDWFFTIMNQYNYGNPDKEKQSHYPKFAFGYKTGTTRIQMGYGKQREGVVCIGGVCRNVPAAYGFSLTVSSSF